MIPDSIYQQINISQQTIYWLCEGSSNDAPSLLAPDETAYLATLRAPKRRHDWLLGRRVAKRLIRAVLAARLSSVPPLEAIVVLPHPDGWPQVSLPALGPAAPPLTLSISHSHDRAFCALILEESYPLGSDIEAIEPRSPGFVADYFTAAEQALLAVAPDEHHPTLANTIWSGKEAALKAIRRGLAEDTRLVTCLPSTDEAVDGWRPLRYRWGTAERHLPPLSGRWCEVDGFVMTLAVGREST
jgi:4'-phosphopantetheinyl transferase